MEAVLYDFSESRADEHARRFLKDWRGSLVCDDFSGYKARFAQGMTEAGCLVHARRKFLDLHAANKSQIAGLALEQLTKVYDINHEVKDLSTRQRKDVPQPLPGRWNTACGVELRSRASQVTSKCL